MSERPQPYDHFEPEEQTTLDAGVYRVVGVGSDSVTLLRVADPDGRRRYTGDVRSVSVSTLQESFRPAENPDSGLAVRDLLAPLLVFPKALAYWLRRLLP